MIRKRKENKKNKEANKFKLVTTSIIGVVTAIIVLWDIFVAFFNEEKRDTVSEMVQELAANWSVPYFVGAVFVSHFFWWGEKILPQPWAFICLAIPFVSMLVLCIFWEVPTIHPMIFLIFGVIMGRLFWPQSIPPGINL